MTEREFPAPVLVTKWDEGYMEIAGRVAGINPSLASRQELNQYDKDILLMTHAVRALLFQAMEKTDDVDTLKRYDEAYEHLQLCQQELWRFGASKKFLRPWDVPKCQCPQMDNNEYHGTSFGPVISQACAIHWDQELYEENLNAGEKKKDIKNWLMNERVEGWESTDKTEFIHDLLKRLSLVDLKEVAAQQGIDKK